MRTNKNKIMNTNNLIITMLLPTTSSCSRFSKKSYTTNINLT